jgi:tetratricopeptide (TPR) repeat protein
MMGTLMRRFRLICAVGCVICVVFVSAGGCASQYSYFIVGSPEEQNQLREFFALLDTYKKETYFQERFVIINQIANLLYNSGYKQKQILFLTTYVKNNSEDEYNGYYLALVARTYELMGAAPFAKYYYKKIFHNYPDLSFKDTYLHLLCLQKLVKMVKRPEERIDYYKELISGYSNYIDLGEAYFFLARTYEEIGEWDQALLSYQQFLKYPDTRVPGFPNAYHDVMARVELYKVPPTWVVSDLNQLVAKIREAIRNKDVAELYFYRAKTNFFAMTWEQKKDVKQEVFVRSTIVDYLGNFLYQSNVVVADKLDVDSNSQEAYLLTKNWEYDKRTWYFYFRRVNYGPDPEINGGWEWCGIFFGEKL